MKKLNLSYFTLTCLENNIFVALERYEISQKNYNKKRHSKLDTPSSKIKASAVGAIKISSDSQPGNKSKENFRPCSLCSDDSSHPIYKCRRFKTPPEKLARLRELGGCVLCSYLNHTEDSCHFKFKNKCINCQNSHFSFLCTNENVNSPTNSVVNSSVIVWSGLTQWDKNSILPTATCKLGDESVRLLRDSGSQINVIDESCLRNFAYKVMHSNIVLSIRGVNVAQDHQTKIVEFQLGIGNKTYVINAVCIPKIEFELELDGLSTVVNRLTTLGYEMADTKLSGDKIDEIKLILGTPSSYCLPVNTIVFARCCWLAGIEQYPGI